MRTWATGTSTSSHSSRCRRTRGFTLIEILVVVFIIGVLSAGVLLSLNIGGSDRPLETERDRLTSLLEYVREQASLQNREFGLRVHTEGYEFVVYEPRSELWERLPNDKILRDRKLPEGLTIAVHVDGRPVILPLAEAKELAPQALLFSSGDLNLFELTLQREASTSGFIIAPGDNDDSITVKPLKGAG